MRRFVLVVALFVVPLAWQTASAKVLCARPSGTLKIRDACRTRETLVDPVALGLQGPPGPPGDPFGPCPSDSVKVGNVCVDKYEASVWSIPAASTALLDKVRHGEATLQDLTDGGATQLNQTSFSIGCTAPLVPMEFPPNGSWTDPVYAVSLPGILPSACVTWFQAVQACALSGKHLLTNEEWQRAAAGTPDPGLDPATSPCTIFSSPTPTGSQPACVSSWGAYDMAGNVYEWVADWTDRATTCTNWPSDYGGDVSCYGGTGSGQIPGAIARGGYFGLFGGGDAGIFAILAINQPLFEVEGIGFRCGR
jgi:sulfatase-modifying factor enzyme 1